MPYDVIIAGAGPVGLFLACELSLRGVRTLVLERLADPHTPVKVYLGMRGLNLPSAEAMYRRGLLPEVKRTSIAWMDPQARGLQPTGSSTPPPSKAPRFAGHFAGIMIDASKINFAEGPEASYVIPGPSVGGGMIRLDQLEEVLATRALALGAEIRYGIALTSFTVSEDSDTGAEDSVTVETSDNQSISTSQTISARYLVGCDGGRSTVRKLAGFDFPGTPPELSCFSAAVEFADPEKLLPGFNLTSRGLYVNGPYPGRLGVAEFDPAALLDRETPITLESAQAALRRVSGTDVTLKALHIASRYTDNARQATTYRKGNVLLAGDAAHVHSPLGGQGMNLGLGDAMNLGWKLAAAIHGTAAPGLLDTYTAERHPIGEWAVNWTRAQVAIMRPDLHSQAICSVLRDLIHTRDGANYFANKVAGTWLSYPLPGDHPLTGRSAPDFEFSDNTRLGPHLEDGKAILLNLTANSDDSLRSAIAPWSREIKYLAAQPKDTKGLAALLIRPDGFVSWATDSLAAPNLEALTTAAARAFQPATSAPSS